jgi:hypothetical protein
MEEEDLVILKWVGPFSYTPNGLGKSLLDGMGPIEESLRAFEGRPVVYLFLGDHPLHGARSLLYIGQTQNFAQRILHHDRWLKQEWRVEVYLAEVSARLNDVERLLIYAHSPHYNGASVSNPKQKFNPPLRIWNEGSFWKLYPEVSSEHPWFNRL